MGRLTAALGPRLAAALGGGAVALVLSEIVFMNDEPVRRLASGDAAAPGGYLLVYAGVAYVARVVMWGFGARGWAGLALSGALLGWLIEGTVVPVVHEAPPLSWLWPSLGWHMIVTFGIGWVALPWLLRQGSTVLRIGALAALGVAWAGWARLFYAEDPALVLPAAEAFAALAAGAGAVLAGGLWLSARPWARFVPGKGDAAAAAILALPLGLLAGWQAGPMAAGLLAMVAASLWALWRLRGPVTPEPPPPARRYAEIAAVPLAAALALPLLPEAPAGWSFAVVLPLTALGTFAWMRAILRAIRGAGGALRPGPR